MNKYLTKVALFGFSTKEKLEKLHTQHFINTHNLYAEHFNKHISDINKDWDDKHPDLKNKVIPTDKMEEYRNHVADSMESKDKMDSLKSKYSEIESKYADNLQKLGANPPQKDYLDIYVHNHHLNLRHG